MFMADVIDFSENADGSFSLTVRVGSKILSTLGGAVGAEDSIKAYQFHDEEFNREIMKGNIDIRGVCREISRRSNA